MLLQETEVGFTVERISPNPMSLDEFIATLEYRISDLKDVIWNQVGMLLADHSVEKLEDYIRDLRETRVWLEDCQVLKNLDKGFSSEQCREIVTDRVRRAARKLNCRVGV